MKKKIRYRNLLLAFLVIAGLFSIRKLNSNEEQFYQVDFFKDGVGANGLTILAIYFVQVVLLLARNFVQRNINSDSFLYSFTFPIVSTFVLAIVFFDSPIDRIVNRLYTKNHEIRKYEVVAENENFTELRHLDSSHRIRGKMNTKKYNKGDTVQLDFKVGLLGYKHSPTLNGEPLTYEKK